MLRPGQPAEGARIARGQLDLGLERRQVLVDQRLVRDVDDLVGVGQGEGVEDDHDRDHERLRDLEGLDDRVHDLLVRRAVELHPARVALRQAVVLVGPDRPARGHGPVDVAHDDGVAPAGGPVEHLVHQGQALGRGGRERPRPGDRRADAGGHGRVLGLDLDELGVERAVGAHLGEELDDLGLRRDRVGGDDLRRGRASRRRTARGCP